MTILEKIEAAGAAGQLMSSAVENLRAFLAADFPAWTKDSIAELVEAGEWSELNDRFYTYLAFGTGGIAAAALGLLADATSIEFVYKVCSFLPAIGLLAVFLPHIEKEKPVEAVAKPA